MLEKNEDQNANKVAKSEKQWSSDSKKVKALLFNDKYMNNSPHEPTK